MSAALMLGVFFAGGWILHLIRSFYVRHLASTIRYHWLNLSIFRPGNMFRILRYTALVALSRIRSDDEIPEAPKDLARRKSASFMTQDKVELAIMNEVLAQHRIRTGASGRLGLVSRRASSEVGALVEFSGFGSFIRFLGERFSLFIASSIVAGNLIAFTAAAPELFLLWGALWAVAAFKYAPDRDATSVRRVFGREFSERKLHFARMIVIPSVLLALYGLSFLFGVELFSMHIGEAVAGAGFEKSVASVPWMGGILPFDSGPRVSGRGPVAGRERRRQGFREQEQGLHALVLGWGNGHLLSGIPARPGGRVERRHAPFPCRRHRRLGVR